MNIHWPKTILFILLTYAGVSAQGQYYGKQQKSSFGLIADGNFSTLYYHGISPSITIGNDCHTLQIGPRIQYGYFAARDNDRYNFVGDLEYRITYFNKWRNVSLFAFFKTEYGFKRRNGFYNYDADYPDPNHADLGLTDLETKFETKSNVFNFYIGQGGIIDFNDHFYCKLNAGMGIGFLTEQTIYEDLDAGVQVGQKLDLKGVDKLQFNLSAGLGWHL